MHPSMGATNCAPMRATNCAPMHRASPTCPSGFLGIASRGHWSVLLEDLRRDDALRVAFLEFADCWWVLEKAIEWSGFEAAYEFVRYALMELKVDPNLRSPGPESWTLLFAAAKYGSVRVFSLLIDAGTDVNAVCWFGQCVVQWLSSDMGSSRIYDKARLLVQCPRFRPMTAADWCESCPIGSWCHKTTQVFVWHVEDVVVVAQYVASLCAAAMHA